MGCANEKPGRAVAACASKPPNETFSGTKGRMSEPLAYYNEIDPYAAAWLRNLIDAGHIARGIVDTRSIEDVRPSDLAGFTQCHFFAGVGVWSYALRLAGWPDDRSVWTGSCPCQPFSTAGKGGGFADERHLWPHWHYLISKCRPPVVFGEQVASKDAGPWLDLVQDDLEGLGGAFGAIPFPAAGVGAPHIRDRLYWVAQWADPSARDIIARGWREGLADAAGERSPHRDGKPGGRHEADEPERLGLACGVADADGDRSSRCRRATELCDQGLPAPSGVVGQLGDADEQRGGRDTRAVHGAQGQVQLRTVGDGAEPASTAHGLADADGGRPGAQRQQRGGEQRQQPQDGGSLQPTAAASTNGYWRTADWIACRDGKWRPVEPESFPLVDGTTARVGRLRAYGNAIVAPAAATFIAATGLV
jgi:DNA (cytosine-5)-methyltransferase 1